MADVISALKRLERAGSEDSRQTEKLCRAADTLADHITATLSSIEAEITHPDVGVDLPRGWVFALATRRLVAPRYQEERGDTAVGSEEANRYGAMQLAEAVATGWLDELAAWLETRTAEASQAETALRDARPQ